MRIGCLFLIGCASAPSSTGAPAAEPTEIATEGKSTVTVLGAPSAEPGATPAAMTDGHCRAQAACSERGACTAKDNTCVAGTWEDCANVAACNKGRCRFGEGACTAVTECKDAHVCATEGRCDNGADGDCIASNCQKASVCAAEGRCTLVEGACLARADRDCEKSAGCKAQQRCRARDGQCVKSCAESDGCKKAGRCNDRAGAKGVPASCIAASDTECKSSELCAESGLCSLGLDGSCVAGDDVECRRARGCKEQGRCTFQKERCVPASAAECAQATIACKVEGRCRFQDGRCIR